MCGQLNDQVALHALREARSAGRAGLGGAFLAVGSRAAARLEDAGYRPERPFEVPGSTGDITPLVQDLLVSIDEWNTELQVDRVLLVYSRHLSGAACEPSTAQLLPIDAAWLASFGREKWPSRGRPMFTMDRDALFSALLREHFFVSLYRAIAESLASENSSRLASMQSAERNIEERIEELTREFHHRRQMSITEELLDIAAGFEALTSGARS
jgi:F-type H+-transporting ATPase subunit gamma